MQSLSKNLWTALLTAATISAYAGERYEIASVDVQKVCKNTNNRSGVIVEGRDMCEVSTDGGKTWSRLSLAALATTTAAVVVGGGAFLIRRKDTADRKKESQKEKAKNLAAIEELKESNPELYTKYKSMTEYTATEFSDIDQNEYYDEKRGVISIYFKYGEMNIQIGAFAKKGYTVFKNDTGYWDTGVWSSNRSNHVSLGHLKSILSSIKNNEATPPKYEPEIREAVNPTTIPVLSEVPDVYTIAEADVCISYGQYKWAIEILKELRRQNPFSNNDVSLRLLEVYGITGANWDFEDLAREMRDDSFFSDTMGDRIDSLRAIFFYDESAISVSDLELDIFSGTDSLPPNWVEETLDLWNTSDVAIPETPLPIGWALAEMQKLQEIIAKGDTDPANRWTASLQLIQLIGQDPSTENTENIVDQLEYLNALILWGQATLTPDEIWAYNKIIAYITTSDMVALMTPETAETARWLKQIQE